MDELHERFGRATEDSTPVRRAMILIEGAACFADVA
jgi:hypothetical protein